jgi:hypothetical protein
MNTYQFDWIDDGFEFTAKMPEELLVKAMSSTRPIFLTDDFMSKVAATSPEDVVRELVSDLHRDADPDDAGDVLRWHYLFMDFERDFPRLLMLSQPDEGEG